MNARYPVPQADRPVRRTLKSARPSLLALEARLMFDGAAVATEPAPAPEPAAAPVADTHLDSRADLAATNTSTEAPASSAPRAIAFVDTNVANWQSLVAQLPPEVEVITLDPARDELSQIVSALDGRTGIAALHLISHGESGTLILGGQKFTGDTLATRQSDLAVIGRALSADGDILLYGCDIGQGTAGQAFIDAIALATAGDVAASTDRTGTASLGGNWTLEANSGVIEETALSAKAYATFLGTPVFSSASTANVAENTTAVLTVAATDPGFTVTYSFGGGADDTLFSIDANSGALTFNSAPNFEAPSDVGVNNVYDVIVQATSSDAGLFDTQAIAVTLTNVDEVAPTITSGGVAAAINENSGAGQVVYTVTSTDIADTSAGVTYALKAGGDAALFSIDAGTGAVTLTGDPDFEAKSSYSFTVQANDGVTTASEQAVTLAINDVNEAPTITSGAAGSVAENAVNSTVIYTAVGADVDAGQTLSYSLSGADAGLLTIDPASGAVTLNTSANFEAKSTYSFNVIATDDGTGSLTGSKAITVTVTNVDEVAPTITSGGVAAAINENSGAGQVVYTVTSTDIADTSAGVTYALKAGGDAALFSIDAGTGAVTLTGDPDFEAKSSYSFTVQANDGVTAASEQVVTLAINNIDEVAPTITSGGVAAAINENSGAGQVVYTVTSTDIADTSAGVTYALKAGGDAALFSIDAGTGAVTLTGDPDFESKASYSFTVQANDGVTTASEQAVTLAINDVNEAPTITSGAAGSVAENAVNSTVIYTAVGADVDAGQTLSYSLSGADAGLLTIDPASGAVTLNTSANFEAKSTYSFNVIATDDGTGSLTGSKAITVTVTNVDEVAPTITSGGVAAAINENSGAGQVVYTVTSTDIADTSAGVTYALKAGGDAALFSIDAGTGAVTLTGDPDFEAKSSYSFTVQANDGVTAASEQVVTLAINDANEAPVITSNGGGASASVSIAENTTAVTTVTATDVDAGATQTYSISGGVDATLFAIDSGTGVLTFVAPPDFETPGDAGGNNVYDLIVQVSDGTLTDTQNIAVTVTAVSDNAPVITSNGGGASASISLAENTTAVTTVTVTDADLPGDTQTYSISGGADAALFSIDSGTGVLTFIAPPDFETPGDTGGNNVYDLIVQVSDGTLTDTQNIAATVTDVGENAPVITSNAGGASASISIAENTTAVTTVAATDVDPGATQTYSISGGVDAALFSIDSSTGVLTFVAGRNFEAPADAGTDNVYDLTVQVSDGTLTDTQNIAVTITDANEAPVITSNGGGASASVSIAENTTAVTTVTATDVDAGATQTYSISGGVDATLFAIDSGTGVLTFVAPPDFETPGDAGGNNVYDLIVQVSDGTLTDTQNIAVTVTAVSDNAPVITSNGGGASASISLAENTTAVTTVTVTDADLPGDTQTYSISGGADAALFSIDSGTGVLTFLAGRNFEAPADVGTDNVYDVTVQVSDGTLTDSQNIAVTITDANEAPVIAGGATLVGSLSENNTLAQPISGSDVDAGATLTYSISAGADAALFSINSSTGVLTLVPPDFEVPTDVGGDNQYDVTVQVSDGSLSATQNVSVIVTDVTEAPVFTSGSTVSVADSVITVMTVAATDPEGDPITYSITGGADAASFSIDPATGALTFVAPPSYATPTDADANNVYLLTVLADDGAGGTTSQNISVTVGLATESSVVPVPVIPFFETPSMFVTGLANNPAGTVASPTALPAEIFGRGENLPVILINPLTSERAGLPNAGVGAIGSGLENGGIFASPAAQFDPTADPFSPAFSAGFNGNVAGNDTPLQMLRIPGSQAALVNFRGIPDVSAGEPGQPISFQIPANAFAQSGSAEAVKLSAALADGRPLPSSLRFNPVSGRFEGTLPDGIKGDMVIKVVARDAQGREANAIFRIKSGRADDSRSGSERGRQGLSEQLRGGRVSALASAR